jgi:hypothetical protein
MLIAACKNESKDVLSTTTDSSIEISKELAIEEQYIENDSLVNLMELELSKLIENPKFVIEKVLVNNRHVDNIVDTIKKYKYDDITIAAYKAVSEEWIFEGKILSSSLEFSKIYKIGMFKQQFEETINTKLRSERVSIGNLEQTSVFIFTFKNNVLVEVNYEGYVD